MEKKKNSAGLEILIFFLDPPLESKILEDKCFILTRKLFNQLLKH